MEVYAQISALFAEGFTAADIMKKLSVTKDVIQKAKELMDNDYNDILE